MILSIKMHIYLQRGKLKKRFNSFLKRKFHLANLTSMRKTKFFKLQKMLTNDEKWCAFYPLILLFFIFYLFLFIYLFFYYFFFCYCSIHNCLGRILQDIIKYFLKHKTPHFFRTLCFFFDIQKCQVLSRHYFKTNIY